jgi:MYXO-CTERM domain-containing protein
MHVRKDLRCRLVLVSLLLAAAASSASKDARAEADTFGIGNGHSGAYVAAAADEVLNAYAPLTADAAANATTLTFGTTIGTGTFAAGDLVMIWRATGVTEAEAPTASAARVDLTAASGGRVGTFEFARVTAATATTITMSKPLVSAWAKDLTQVVRVPELTTVSVPAGTSIVAAPWQASGAGFAGGILVLFANGVVTIDGRVHADGRGFQGGKKDTNFDLHLGGCADNDNTEANGYAAKGEGVASTTFGGATHGGKGNRANGGGGGNCAENGGGGGGNFGAGGAGGKAVLAQARAGLGGSGLDYSLLSRISMGGGGGAGEQKNGVGSGGGAGGGAVFVRVRAIAGAGTLSADGEAAQNAGLFGGVESDGAGGGGAGGSLLIRAVDTVACTSAETKGGKGGDTDVLAVVGLFGAGGGGGGGRVLIQAKTSAACATNVDPGPGGTSGNAGAVAAAGIVGLPEPVPAPGGSYCFSNPATDPQCANPSPVCDPASGFCFGCTGPFGGGTARACGVAVQPVCAANGSCNPCNGDFGTGAQFECQLTGSPFCNTAGALAGSCGKCTSNADCAGAGHGGTLCDVSSGTCGTPCTDDSQCKAGKEWCSTGVCVPKTPNGQHVPTQSPINGDCTVESGKRVCLSAVCEVDDDLCGLKNGSPCMGAAEKCRSTICFPADQLCGKPGGEPCAINEECRSLMCVAGKCTGAPAGADAGADAGNNGDAGSGADAGANDSGLLEGGGCACRTSVPVSGSPFALAAAAVGALLVARRRRQTRNENDTKERG